MRSILSKIAVSLVSVAGVILMQAATANGNTWQWK